jgi:hypothetical protein
MICHSNSTNSHVRKAKPEYSRGVVKVTARDDPATRNNSWRGHWVETLKWCCEGHGKRWERNYNWCGHWVGILWYRREDEVASFQLHRAWFQSFPFESWSTSTKEITSPVRKGFKFAVSLNSKRSHSVRENVTIANHMGYPTVQANTPWSYRLVS